MKTGIDCHGKEWEEYTEYYHPKFDISNQTFGELTALFRVKNNTASKQAAWLCSCSCGNEVVVLAADLVGQKFGLLTVLELAERPKTAIGTGSYWKCRCDCGKEIITSQRALSVGQIHSCGCLKQSYGEYCITQILEENDITFQSEYTFPDLHGEGGGRLRYDFAVFDEDDNLIRLIEFDGPQHYEIGSGYYNSEEKNSKDPKARRS